MGQASELALASLRSVAILATSHALLPMSSSLLGVSHTHVWTSVPGSAVTATGSGAVSPASAPPFRLSLPEGPPEGPPFLAGPAVSGTNQRTRPEWSERSGSVTACAGLPSTLEGLIHEVASRLRWRSVRLASLRRRCSGGAQSIGRTQTILARSG